MITINFKINPATIETMKAKGPSIVKILTTRISILMQQLVSYVQVTKLSGQIVTPRSGRLRGSVHALPTTIEATKIIGTVESSGSVAFYGHVFENDGQSDFQIRSVKARALRFISGGETIFAKVVNHKAQIARPFMRPSQDDNATKIVAELNAAVNGVINGE